MKFDQNLMIYVVITYLHSILRSYNLKTFELVHHVTLNRNATDMKDSATVLCTVGRFLFVILEDIIAYDLQVFISIVKSAY